MMVYLIIAPQVEAKVVHCLIQAGVDVLYVNPQDQMSCLAIALANKTTP